MKLLSLNQWFGRASHETESSTRPVGRTRNGSLPRYGTSLTAGLLVSLLLLSSAGAGLAQTVDTTLWVTDNTVNTVLRDGGTIYIGGDFTLVGPVTGGGVAIDASTGAAHQPYPQVAGAVNVVAPDGSGGWYLGGSFTAVRGQPRNRIAALYVGNGVATIWNPNANGTVNTLA